MDLRNYNKCVSEYADYLFRFCLKNLGNEEDAKDIVQFSFQKLWEKRQNVDDKTSKSYLFTIANNAMIDLRRKETRRRELTPVFADSTQEKIVAFDMKDSINKALQKITPTQKSLILLRDYEGFSYDEIAEVSGLSLSQVKVYIFRGRKKLQKLLSEVQYA